jgi:hypothetical protein
VPRGQREGLSRTIRPQVKVIPNKLNTDMINVLFNCTYSEAEIALDAQDLKLICHTQAARVASFLFLLHEFVFFLFCLKAES